MKETETRIIAEELHGGPVRITEYRDGKEYTSVTIPSRRRAEAWAKSLGYEIEWVEVK